MVEVLRSLSEIATNYWLFEKDQVLTHKHLNEVVAYLDDQTRLTRVGVLGVGALCGLRVAPRRDQITLSKGVGITTDGDVVYFAADTNFDQFKEFTQNAEDAPRYGPFQVAGTGIPLFELVQAGATDEQAHGLADFGADLASMVATLYVESSAQDQDLCSGTDCDNLGLRCVNRVRLLLLDQSHAAALMSNPAVPDEAALRPTGWAGVDIGSLAASSARGAASGGVVP